MCPETISVRSKLRIFCDVGNDDDDVEDDDDDDIDDDDDDEGWAEAAEASEVSMGRRPAMVEFPEDVR